MPPPRSVGTRRGGPIGAAALAGALLAGCVTGPVYAPPVIRAPERWGPEPKSASRTVQGEEDVELRWWRSFRDPLLVSLVDRLGAQNLDLKTAYERVVQSSAQIRITAAQGLPRVEGTSQEAYLRASPNGLLRLVEPAPGSKPDFTLYNEGLAASWELDFFGRIRHAVEAADAETLASVEARHGVALAALAELAQGYLQLRGVQTRLAIARRNLSLAGQDVALVQSRFANGVANTLDLAQARAQEATFAAALPPLLAREAELINAIGLLLGEVPRALESTLRPARALPRVPRAVPVGLPVNLLGRRPDVREAEARLRATVAQTGVAAASFYPSVSLNGTLDVQSLTLGRLFNLASTAWQVGPSVTIPIFEGGRLKGNLELRESQQREAAVRFQKVVLTAWQQVDDARTAYAQAQGRRGQLARAVAQNQIALSAARQRYTEGASDFLNVNTVLAQLLQSQNDLAEAEVQIATTLVQLYRALGGGWDVADGPDGLRPPPPVAGPPLAIPSLLDGLASAAVQP
ncbi:efflux transporter outer membrane subunit [Methylobacterium sp. C1]|uniref:efflux transporter outer membrane subunit n=1 Tax=Methylobacterium sp. C1 TaxID=1479019 RepID=UPI0008DB254F|nr:efflux transporter outer membrane subunit [Methylobacterium sp. C1]